MVMMIYLTSIRSNTEIVSVCQCCVFVSVAVSLCLGWNVNQVEIRWQRCPRRTRDCLAPHLRRTSGFQNNVRQHSVVRDRPWHVTSHLMVHSAVSDKDGSSVFR